MGLFSPLLSSPSWPPSPRLTLTPPPTTTAHTATPDTTDTDTAEDTDTDTADTTDITVILMADTEDTLTITASVPLMPNLRLRPRLIPLTCMPVTTAMPVVTPMAPTATLTLTAMPDIPMPLTTAPPLPLPPATNTCPPPMPPTTMVDTTATPDTDTPAGTTDTVDTTEPDTAIPMPDTELTGISASVPLMLRPEHPLPTPAQPPLSLPVAPKAPVVSMASLMLMPPTTAIPSDTTVKLSYSWRGLL